MIEQRLSLTFHITSYNLESRAQIDKRSKKEICYPNCTICYNETGRVWDTFPGAIAFSSGAKVIHLSTAPIYYVIYLFIT